jgi:diacylglycerol kinase (ATP)
MKPVLIVNPASSGGNTGRVWKDLQSVIERGLGACEVVMTKHQGHGRHLATDAAASGAELVVAVGGDGTISEVVDGVLSAGKDTEVGIVGQGTGGDFRKSLGIEHRLSAYVEHLKKPARKVDVGHVSFRDAEGNAGSRHFINVVSCGMGGLVDQYVQTASKTLGGTVAYYGASVRALMNIERGRLRCTTLLDGKEEVRELETYVLAVCNGQYFGSGMHIAPMANVSSGAFEVIALESKSKLDFALNSSAIYSGKHMKTATHFRAQTLTVELLNERAADSFLIDLDGEPVGKLSMTVTMKPGAVRIRHE